MSLTSYRAAPPRAKRKSLWDLSRLRHRVAMADCAGANCRRRFVSCQGCTVFDASFPEMRMVLQTKKDRFERPFGFGRAECVSRRLLLRLKHIAFSRPGSDLLSRVLRRSTIGAGAFHGRVRNGNGCGHPAITTRSAKGNVMRSWQAFACLSYFMNTSFRSSLSPRPEAASARRVANRLARRPQGLRPVRTKDQHHQCALAR